MLAVGFLPPVIAKPSSKVPKAILPLKKKYKATPMLALALRDPDLMPKEKFKDRDLSIFRKRIKTVRNALNKSRGPQKTQQLRDYFRLLVKYSYFWDDALNERVKTGYSKKKITQIISNLRGSIKNIGFTLYQNTKNRNEKVHIVYQTSLVDFLVPAKRAKAVSKLKKIVKLQLDERRKNLVKLALNIDAIDRGTKKEKRKALKSLLKLHNFLSRKASTLSHLYIAKATNSRKASPNSGKVSTYRKHLQIVSRLCQNLTSVERSDILKMAVTIWQSAKDFDGNWINIPFQKECFNGATAMKAIQERIARQHWNKGQYRVARYFYEKLAKDTKDSLNKAKFEERIIAAQHMDYLKTGSSDKYQKLLIAYEKKNRGSPYGLRIQKHHYDMIIREMSFLSQRHGAEAHKVEQTVNRYFKTQVDNHRSHDIKKRLASIYVQKKAYAKAEKIYGELVRSIENPADSLDFLKRQIVVQANLANWNMMNPWASVRIKTSENREHLLRLFYNLMQQAKTLSWDVSKHVGLLEIDLNRPDKAFFVWENALKAFPKDKEAPRALGLMISSLKRTKKWDKIESLSYLASDLGVSPVHKGKKISLHEVLELALREGSKNGIAQKRFEYARKKLVVLESSFSTSPRLQEYLFLLSECYKGLNLHEERLSSLNSILSLSSTSPFYKKALLEAAAIHIGMANPNKALKMFLSYLQNYKGKDSNNEILMRMSEIYSGLSKPKEAYQTLMAIRLDRLSVGLRNSVKRKIFKMQQKIGDRSKILHVAAEHVKHQETTNAMKSRSFAVLAQYAFSKNDTVSLKALESQISKLDRSDKSVNDIHSYVLYLQAKLKSESIINSFKKVITERFDQSLAFLESSYAEVGKSFVEVCKSSTVAYCVPSMQDLLAFNKKIASYVQDIAVDSQMTEEKKKLFKQHKERIIESLSGEYKALRNQSIAYLKKGNTLPNATRKLLWQNNNDWNFRNGIESGTGFMQISKEYVNKQEPSTGSRAL